MSNATATEATPATQPGNVPSKQYGQFEIRSRVVQQYTHLVNQTAVKNMPTLVAWLVCKNMEFLWWLKTDVQKNGIEVNEGSGTQAAGTAELPEFLSNGMKVTGSGSQSQRKAS